MTYEFEDVATGERVERIYPAGKAPRVGRVITVRGRKLRRVVSLGQRAIAKSCEATCLSFDAEQRKHALAVGCQQNQHGEIEMRTARQRDEISARTGLRFNPD